jgi:hypothetical protein
MFIFWKLSSGVCGLLEYLVPGVLNICSGLYSLLELSFSPLYTFKFLCNCVPLRFPSGRPRYSTIPGGSPPLDLTGFAAG